MTTTRALIEASEIARINAEIAFMLEQQKLPLSQRSRSNPHTWIEALTWVLALLPSDAPSPDRERAANVVFKFLEEHGRTVAEANEGWGRLTRQEECQHPIVTKAYEIVDALAALTAADPIPIEPTDDQVRDWAYRFADDTMGDTAGVWWSGVSKGAKQRYRTMMISAAPVLSGRGETGWRRLDKEADFDTNGWLWAPPENLFSEPEGRDGVIYFGKPRNWTWATMIWPVVQPAPPAKPSGVGE